MFQQVTTPSSSLNQGAVIVLYTYIVNPFVQYINSVLFFKGPSFDASDASIVLLFVLEVGFWLLFSYILIIIFLNLPIQ